MRGLRVLAVLAVGLLGLGALWAAGASAPARAQETGVIAGWVYWGAPPYAYGIAAPGAVPAGQPAERGDVEPGGELPPAPQPPSGAQAPDTPPSPDGAQCANCPRRPYRYQWPQPVQGALVAVQGTGLSATTDGDGWFTIEGVPPGTYQTVAATIAPGAMVVPWSGSGAAPYPVPYSRGMFALRANVLVHDAAKPANIGALFIGGSPYMPAGPQPDVPNQGQAPATPEQPASGE